MVVWLVGFMALRFFLVLGRLVGSEGFDFFGWLIFPNVGFSAFSWFHGLSGFGFLLQIFCLLVYFFLNFWSSFFYAS